MPSERSIEVRVGILILLSVGILGAFILVLGGLSFKPTYAVYVDFDDPGALQSGAPVRIAGVRVGKVDALEFRGGAVDPATGRRTLVRARLALDRDVKASLHDDALFYVTTQGVLGEQFLSVEPGSLAKPLLAEGAVVRGIDPPRIDLFLAKAYELLDTTVSGLRNNRELIGEIALNAAGVLKNANVVLGENRDRIGHTMDNLEQLSREAKELTVMARTRYVDNPKIERTIDNIDRLTTDLQRDATPLLKDAREAAANLNRVSATLGSSEEQAKLAKAVHDLEDLAGRVDSTAADAQIIVAHVKKGQGSVGALVMDEELYDDVQEMVRDLKHNPWKFLWKQ